MPFNENFMWHIPGILLICFFLQISLLFGQIFKMVEYFSINFSVLCAVFSSNKPHTLQIYNET